MPPLVDAKTDSAWLVTHTFAAGRRMDSERRQNLQIRRRLLMMLVFGVRGGEIDQEVMS